MISTDLCDKKKFTENLMSRTCPVTLFGGVKKGLPNLEALVLFGAGTKSRTRDLLITSQLLYQLSYAGDVVNSIDSA